MRLTPINMAEAIFEPFWDMELNELDQWQISPGGNHGLDVAASWSLTRFLWTRSPESGPALEMRRVYAGDPDHTPAGVDCTGYDELLVSIMPPSGSRLTVSLETDAGPVDVTSPEAGSQKREYRVPLAGASRIAAITLQVHAAPEGGMASGWFNWLGLQNSTLLPRYLDQWKRFDSRWRGYLREAEFEPSFTPTSELVITADELESLRARHEAESAERGSSEILDAAAAARSRMPEAMIGEYVNFWTDTRYCRERDYGNLLLRHGVAAAVAGLVTRDAELLRLGARYAMALARCSYWDDGFICRFPEGTFEHRSFVQSLCAWETSVILDLAGELFTPLGRETIFRRIAEEAIGHIQLSTWKHEYIFHCNQLAWFSPGRMLGLATLGTEWPRTRWYLEHAKVELVESLDSTILPDGGYVEGPSYFRCVGRDAGLSLFYYARATGTEFTEVIPESMRRTADFAEALLSTDELQDVIPICDGRPIHDQESLAIMAAAIPNSQWVRMFRESFGRTGGSEHIVVYQMLDRIPDCAPPLRSLVVLPEMGVMASVRRLGDATVKLFLMGNRAGAGHTHEDKGSFVLEIAGETFAMDPGTCDYSSPMSLILKSCQRHNMLLPTGLTERPHPASPLPHDVKPTGSGDDRRFSAEIDVTPGWDGFYTLWRRRFESDRPEVLTITDEYELAAGDGVEFAWNTRLPVSIRDGAVIIDGRHGSVEIATPADAACDVERLPIVGDDYQNRIAIRKHGRSGTLAIEARYRAKEERE